MRTHVTHPPEVPVSHPHAHHARRRYLETPGKSPQSGSDVTPEQIARRAYELYLARGNRPGDALGDWLEAERELRSSAPVFRPLTKHTDSDLAH